MDRAGKAEDLPRLHPPDHSMTSSAQTSIAAGIVRPSPVAVLSARSSAWSPPARRYSSPTFLPFILQSPVEGSEPRVSEGGRADGEKADQRQPWRLLTSGSLAPGAAVLTQTISWPADLRIVTAAPGKFSLASGSNLTLDSDID